MTALGDLRIKYKALILVAATVVTAVAMFGVSYTGLSSIKDLLDGMVLSTNVERYAFSTILEEKNYLLNANGSTSNEKLAAAAFANAERDVRVIIDTLDKIDAQTDSASLRQRSKEAREGTNTYADLYRRGVAALVSLAQLTKSLELDGETATGQAAAYAKATTDAGKKATALDILNYTYLIRANEKRYMLNQKPEIFEEMKTHFALMMGLLAKLESSVADDKESSQVVTFKKAALDYEKSAHTWVEKNNVLFHEILPQMKELGDKVIKLAFNAAQEAGEQVSAARQSIILWLMGIGAGIAVFGVLLGMFVANAIARPVVGLTGVMAKLVQGDLAVDVPSVDQKDEIGMMARSVQGFKDGMILADQRAREQEAERRIKEERAVKLESLVRNFEGTAAAMMGKLSSGSSELETTAKEMTGTVAETDQQASAVAGAAEEASSGVQTVASAAEELAASISEISRQVQHSAKVTSKVVTDAERTDVIVRALSDAGDRIGHVVGLIANIAGQTNLLALNATIEAARAGDAGKGFAVVASEVKGLATQTARATEDISQQVSQIQSATKEAVAAIHAISMSVAEVNSIAATIAAAVEEQGAATSEIARNVQQTSHAAQGVTENIKGVSRSSSEAGAAANQVLSAAGEMSRQAERLAFEVNSFLTDVRAA